MIDYTNDIPVKKVTYPVDMLMEGLPEISMMKIDTQGSELEVLKGANKVLKEVEVSIAIALILFYEFIYSPKRKFTKNSTTLICIYFAFLFCFVLFTDLGAIYNCSLNANTSRCTIGVRNFKL